MKSMYRGMIHGGSYVHSFLALMLRLFFGFGFLHAGMGKIATFDETISFFQSLGLPFPMFQLYLVALTEIFGGILLIIGFANRLIALPLILITTIAYLTAHREAFALMMSNPMAITEEPPFPYLVASLYLLAHGPGKLSLDGLIKRLFLGDESAE